jgi:hypothetical protein
VEAKQRIPEGSVTRSERARHAGIASALRVLAAGGDALLDSREE